MPERKIPLLLFAPAQSPGMKGHEKHVRIGEIHYFSRMKQIFFLHFNRNKVILTTGKKNIPPEK